MKNLATEKLVKSRRKGEKNLLDLSDDSKDSHRSDRSPNKGKSPINRLRRQTQPSFKIFSERDCSENGNWYQKYNLIMFILQEFERPIREFTGYFSEFYSYLNKFGQLLQKDIKV